MPLHESCVDDRAVTYSWTAFGHKGRFPEPHDPVNEAFAIRDQQKRDWPELTRSSPRQRPDSARLKPLKIPASGGRLGDKTHPE
jgi:hypothetical protein